MICYQPSLTLGFVIFVKVVAMENYGGDRANEELITSLGDTMIIEELNAEEKGVAQSDGKDARVIMEEIASKKCIFSEDLKSDINKPVIGDGILITRVDGLTLTSENKFEVSQETKEIRKLCEGNSRNELEKSTLLGETSDGEAIQKGGCNSMSVYGKTYEDEDTNECLGHKKIKNYLHSKDAEMVSGVKETNINHDESVAKCGTLTSEYAKMEANTEVASCDCDPPMEPHGAVAFEECTQNKENLNEFKIANNLSGIDAKMPSENAESTSTECGDSESLTSPDITKDCDDDDLISKFEKPSGTSHPESESDSTEDEYKRFHGHKFDENFVLRDRNGERFNYNFYENHYKNQRRYEDIGEEINDYIYGLLISRNNMVRHYIPFDARPDEPQGFFFASENAEKTEDKLLILIHGSGVVRAGQWARRIIINDNLLDGSQIPYIEEAKKEGYEVVVLNTNQNQVKHQFIRGSRDPEEHASYVWDNFIMKRVKAKHIAIMAHSYGGAVTVSLAEKNCFKKRVFAIGFSDSVHSFGLLSDSKVKDFFKKRARNWVTSEKELDTPISNSFFSSDCIQKVSAGHLKHEWTSTTCMKSVFSFFKEKLKKLHDQGSEVDQKSSSSKKMKANGNPKNIEDDQHADCDHDSEIYFSTSEEIGHSPPSCHEYEGTINLNRKEEEEEDIEGSDREGTVTIEESVCKYKRCVKKGEKKCADNLMPYVTKTEITGAEKIGDEEGGQVSNS